MAKTPEEINVTGMSNEQLLDRYLMFIQIVENGWKLDAVERDALRIEILRKMAPATLAPIAAHTDPPGFQDDMPYASQIGGLPGKPIRTKPAEQVDAARLEKIARETVAEIAKGFYDPNDREEYGRREPWLSIGQGTLRNYIVKALQEAASLKQETQPPSETAWLCEDGSVRPSYITVADGHLRWTTDSLKALRLARRADAEMIAEIVDDCWRVAEHMWSDAASSSPLETPAAANYISIADDSLNGNPSCHVCGAILTLYAKFRNGMKIWDCLSCGERITQNAHATKPAETPAAVLEPPTANVWCKCPYAKDQSQEWHTIGSPGCKATPAPADTGAADEHCKLCGQKENCSVHEDSDRKYWHAFVSDLPLSETEIDEAFAGMATDEAYQKMTLDLASTGDTPQPQEDAQILIRNGYCPKHKIKMKFECFNILGDGRDYCSKCDEEEALRLKAILAATLPAREAKEK